MALLHVCVDTVEVATNGSAYANTRKGPLTLAEKAGSGCRTVDGRGSPPCLTFVVQSIRSCLLVVLLRFGSKSIRRFYA